MLTRKSPLLSAPVRALGELGTLFRLATRKERRRHPRLPGALTGELSIRREDLGLPRESAEDGKLRESIPVRVHDVSLGGMGMQVQSRDLPRGNLSLLGLNLDQLRGRVPVTVRVETERGTAVLRGEITSQQLVEPDDLHLAVELGMAFIAPSDVPAALRAWLDHSRGTFTRAYKALRRSGGLRAARELIASLGFRGLDDNALEKLIHTAAQSLGLERRHAPGA